MCRQNFQKTLSHSNPFFLVFKEFFRREPISKDQELKAVADLFEVSYGFPMVVIARFGD